MLKQGIKDKALEFVPSPRGTRPIFMSQMSSNTFELSPVKQQDYEKDLSHIYDTVNTVIHKIDELKQMKITNDGKVLLNIIFKLNAEVLSGVISNNQLDHVRDVVDSYGRTISDMEACLRLKEEEIFESQSLVRDEHEVNQELSNQIKMFQQE